MPPPGAGTLSEADRERELRRLERDRRRRERGGPTYFEPSTLVGVGPDDPTVNLRPEELGFGTVPFEEPQQAEPLEDAELSGLQVVARSAREAFAALTPPSQGGFA